MPEEKVVLGFEEWTKFELVVLAKILSGTFTKEDMAKVDNLDTNTNGFIKMLWGYNMDLFTPAALREEAETCLKLGGLWE